MKNKGKRFLFLLCGDVGKGSRLVLQPTVAEFRAHE
jgi:hypothetical protein